MVDTTALVGTAKVGSALVGSLGATPPVRVRVHGACWQLVADQAAIDAAKAHTADREQAVRDDLALVAQEKADAAKQAAIDAAAEAATAADEALEAALGELVEGKSNVFIQATAPVESMRRTGVLWIDTTPVTLADGTTAPGHTPKTWDPTTSAWVAVTDSVAVEAARAAAAAHEAAEAAAAAAGTAMAEARYAPRIADRMPTPTDGEGKPDGAGWWQYDPTSQLLVQGWRWTGAVWERLDMDPVMIPVIQIGTGTVGDLTGDRVTVTGEFVARVAQILQLDVAQLTVTEGAVINDLVAKAMAAATAEFQTAYIQNLRSNGAVMDEAVIGDLAANIITSGLFRTAAEGQRLEIDSNGLIMWGVDPDGVEYEMVRLGPDGVNLLTIGQTTVAPDGIQSPSAAFEQLSVGGDDLTTILERLPRGVREWGELKQDSQYHSDPTIFSRRAELQTTVEPNRLYRVSLSSHYLATDSASATTAIEELRYSFDATPVNIQVNVAAGTYIGEQARQHVWNGAGRYVPGMTFHFNTGDFSGERIFWLMWLVRPENSSAAVKVLGRSVSRPILELEDMGPAKPEILKRWNDGNGGEAQDTAPTVRRYTKVYTATGFGGDTSGGDVVQGQYASYGNRSGGWTFPSMTGDLAGATIERIRVFLYANHWYSSAGGTASIRATNGSHKGHTGPVITSANWPRNAGRWVTLPASMHDGFKAGTYKGIGVQTSSTSLTYYGRFAGNPSDPARKAKIEIQYRK